MRSSDALRCAAIRVTVSSLARGMSSQEGLRPLLLDRRVDAEERLGRLRDVVGQEGSHDEPPHAPPVVLERDDPVGRAGEAGVDRVARPGRRRARFTAATVDAHARRPSGVLFT